MRVFPDGQQARNNNLNYWSYLHWVFGNLINMGFGWSAPIQVTPFPIDSCYSLNRGIRHLERSFHLSSTQGGLSPPLTTLGDYHPLERIITSHYPGGLSPPREDYHLSPCRFRIVTPICREKWPAVHIWSTSSLTPFPHNNSGLVICFYLKGYGLGALLSPRSKTGLQAVLVIVVVGWIVMI